MMKEQRKKCWHKFNVKGLSVPLPKEVNNHWKMNVGYSHLTVALPYHFQPNANSATSPCETFANICMFAVTFW